MKILVINGECLQVNTSSNLCNLAYLRGLVETGNEVVLLSASGKGYTTDPDMVIPEEVKCITYNGMTLYEKLSIKKKKKSEISTQVKKESTTTEKPSRNIKSCIKKRVFSLYGVHGTYIKFAINALRFRSKDTFDYMISLSTPATSHLIAYYLITLGHVKCKHWIQIWEDPWYSDVDGSTANERVFREEKRLLAYADKVCYVSPITLVNQKKLYPESAEKMFWVPLPSYYRVEKNDASEVSENLFGYFGDYRRRARDLLPFYQAADTTGIEVNICGYSDLLLKKTERIHVYPRLSLVELKPIEKKTGVLVFLCNRKGGQIPGKIYQYAATNKTILFILDGTEEEKRMIRSFFEPFNRFVFCNNNREEIINAIRRIINKDCSDVLNKPLSQFNPDRIINRILNEGVQ